jgi:Ras-related protein Rab-8A
MMYWNNFYCYVDQSRIQLYVEDTAGCERYRFILPVYYNSAPGIVFVFDVCDRESLLKID